MKFFQITVLVVHYDDVIMTMLASQITSLTVVYSIVYSGVNQRKHQSSASLAFVREISRTNGQLRGKCFHLMTSSCLRFIVLCCGLVSISLAHTLQGYFTGNVIERVQITMKIKTFSTMPNPQINCCYKNISQSWTNRINVPLTAELPPRSYDIINRAHLLKQKIRPQ